MFCRSSFVVTANSEDTEQHVLNLRVMFFSAGIRLMCTYFSHQWLHSTPYTNANTHIGSNLCSTCAFSYSWKQTCTLTDSDHTPRLFPASMPLGWQPTTDRYPSKSLMFPDAAEKWHVVQLTCKHEHTRTHIGNVATKWMPLTSEILHGTLLAFHPVFLVLWKM